MSHHVSPLTAVFFCLVVAHQTAAAENTAKITFKKTQLDARFRSEGACIADFNHDSRLDIAAGGVYYAAPDWRMHAIFAEPQEFDPKGYSGSFCNFSDDLNGDGWADLILVDFPGQQTWWFENPQASGVAWKRHTCVPETNNESPTYLDLDGDGRRELVYAAGAFMAYARPADAPTDLWRITHVSAADAPGTNRYSHGLGVGDVNGDGRSDILVIQGWWECPPDAASLPWKFHPAPFGPDCAQMHVYDFDGDGDNDVLSSSAHNFGIWWHEQTGDGWKTHEIDKSYSQTHSICLTDVNGDGLPDFVTGKRWWAHGGADPGGEQPAVFFWYELTRKQERPVWIPHQFDHDSGVGTQFEMADINADGLVDIATASKKGVYYHEQLRE